MANFQTCEESGYLNQSAVNLDLCQSITVGDECMPDGPRTSYTPALIFSYPNHTIKWLYNTEAERDAEYKRIIELCNRG